jgi:hypothetical protein
MMREWIDPPSSNFFPGSPQRMHVFLQRRTCTDGIFSHREQKIHDAGLGPVIKVSDNY